MILINYITDDQLVKKWNDGELDERLESFKNIFSAWIEQIPEEKRPLIEKLLFNFNYYSKRKVNIFLTELHQKLMSLGVDENNTIFTFIQSKDGKSNSSNDYWTEYKGLNNLNKEICITDVKRIQEKYWYYIKNVVIIDDFCGTGDSLIKYIERNSKFYENKKVYFLIVHLMEMAKNRIKENIEKLNIDVEIIEIKSMSKAFDLKNLEKEEREELVQLSKSKKIPSIHILGFGESESLVAFHNNTPNNTIGIFRYDVENGYFSIFPREKTTRPSWKEMKEDKKNRSNANYNSLVNGSDKDEDEGTEYGGFQKTDDSFIF